MAATDPQLLLSPCPISWVSTSPHNTTFLCPAPRCLKLYYMLHTYWVSGRIVRISSKLGLLNGLLLLFGVYIGQNLNVLIFSSMTNLDLACQSLLSLEFNILEYPVHCQFWLKCYIRWINRLTKWEYNHWNFDLGGNQAEKLYKMCQGILLSFLLQVTSSACNCSSPSEQKSSNKLEASFAVHLTGLCISGFHIFAPYAILSLQINIWLLGKDRGWELDSISCYLYIADCAKHFIINWISKRHDKSQSWLKAKLLNAF